MLVKTKQDVADADRIPRTIGGVGTDVIETGEIVPHANLSRVRPALGGVSVGNANSGLVGTLGYFLGSEADRRVYALSNNHVMGLANLANVGDNILQQGAGDGGVAPRDAIGTLFRFPFLSNGLTADCAVARVNAGLLRRPPVRLAALDGFSAPTLIPGWFGWENPLARCERSSKAVAHRRGIALRRARPGRGEDPLMLDRFGRKELRRLHCLGREVRVTRGRVTMHYAPTYSSWLTQVELWFAKVERDCMARGIFTSTTDSRRNFMHYIRAHNKTCRPFRWAYALPKHRIHATAITETAR